MIGPEIFRHALDSLRECAVIVDAQAPDQPVIYVNRAFEIVTGYRADEVIGRNCRFLQGKQTNPAAIAQIREAIDAGAGCDVRLLNYRKDGGAFHNELRIAPITDERGTVTHFIGLQRDVTREVVAENLAQTYSEELESLNAELHHLALRDPLTDLHNRRYFDTRIEVMQRTAARSHRPLSVFLVDLDHFKALNDHYGHQRGDDCLTAVGQAIAETTRQGDLAARYGGEEFVIATIGQDAPASRRFANRLRTRIAALRLPNERSPVADHVTISVGYATALPDDKLLAEQLVEAADRALYDAKETGRNRAVAADHLTAEAAAP